MYCRICRVFAVWKKKVLRRDEKSRWQRKNESREAVPRASVEANTAVKDEGKAEKKAVIQKKAMPGKDKPERGADLGVRTV